MLSSTPSKLSQEHIEAGAKVLGSRTRMSEAEFAVEVKLPRSFVSDNNLMEKSREFRKNLIKDRSDKRTQSRSERIEQQRVQDEIKGRAAEFAEQARKAILEGREVLIEGYEESPGEKESPGKEVKPIKRKRKAK